MSEEIKAYGNQDIPDGQEKQLPATANSSKPGPALPAKENMFQTLLKFVGLAGAVSASMGLPSVYLHFKELGIPTLYIDYQQVISAGIFPTIIAVSIAVYFRQVVKNAKEKNESSKFIIILLLPLALPFFPVYAVGAVALAIIMFWGLTWLIIKPFELLGLFSIENREILFVTIILALLGTVLHIFRKHIEKIRVVKAVVDFFSAYNVNYFGTKGLNKGQTSEKKKKEGKKKTKEQEAKEWLRYLPIFWIVMPAVCVGSLYAVKGSLFIWEESLAEILSTGTIYWLGIGVGFGISIIMSAMVWMEFLQCDTQKLKIAGLAICGGSLLVGGIFCVSLYTTNIYPVLSQAWGGGKPEAITIWIEKKELPSIQEIKNRIPDVNIYEEDRMLKIGPAFTLATSKHLIVLSKPKTDGECVVIPLDIIKMSATAQEIAAEIK